MVLGGRQDDYANVFMCHLFDHTGLEMAHFSVFLARKHDARLACEWRVCQLLSGRFVGLHFLKCSVPREQVAWALGQLPVTTLSMPHFCNCSPRKICLPHQHATGLLQLIERAATYTRGRRCCLATLPEPRAFDVLFTHSRVVDVAAPQCKCRRWEPAARLPPPSVGGLFARLLSELGPEDIDDDDDAVDFSAALRDAPVDGYLSEIEDDSEDDCVVVRALERAEGAAAAALAALDDGDEVEIVQPAEKRVKVFTLSAK